MRPLAVSHASDRAKTAPGRLAHPLDTFDGCQSPNAQSVSARIWPMAHHMRPRPVSTWHTLERVSPACTNL